MSRRIRRLVVLAALGCLALAGVAQAAVPTTPGSGNARTVFKVSVKGAKVAQAERTANYLQAVLSAPAGADGECRSHHTPRHTGKGSGARRVVSFRLDPNDLYSKKWCKGTWRVKIQSVVEDDTGNPTATTLATSSFRVR